MSNKNNFDTYSQCRQACSSLIPRDPQSGEIGDDHGQGGNDGQDGEGQGGDHDQVRECPNGNCPEGHAFLPPGLIEQLQNFLTGSQPSPTPTPTPRTVAPFVNDEPSRDEPETLMSQADYCTISRQHTMCAPQVMFS